MVAKYPYLEMERDYVTAVPAKSLRRVGLDHGVEPSKLSSVSTYAKAHGWAEKRAAFQGRTDEKVYEALAVEEAERQLREVTVKNNAIDLIDESITSARAALKERQWVREMNDKGEFLYVERAKYPVTVNGVVALIDRLDRLFGQELIAPPEAGNGSGLGQLTAGDGRVDLIGVIARFAGQRSGVAEPRRVGAGAGSPAADTGED